MLLLVIMACGGEAPPSSAPEVPAVSESAVPESAPEPSLADRLQSTLQLARREHAQGHAAQLMGAYLAHGAKGYNALFAGVAPLFGGDLQGASLRSEGDDLVISKDQRSWSLHLPGPVSYAQPWFPSFVNQVLDDLGSEQRLVQTLGSDRYYIALHRLRIDGYLDQGLLLDMGTPIHRVGPDAWSVRPVPDPSALADQPLDALAAGIREAASQARGGRLNLTGFGRFSFPDGELRFQPDRGLNDAVASGRARTAPYAVRQATLGSLTGEQAGHVLAVITTELAMGSGAVLLPGLCTLYRVDQAPRVGQDASGQPKLMAAKTTVAAEALR